MSFSYTAIVPMRSKDSDRLRIEIETTGPASYATGGEALDLANVGLTQIDSVTVCGVPRSSTACRVASYDYTNNKLQWYDMAGAEIAAGVDLSSFSVRLIIEGR